MIEVLVLDRVGVKTFVIIVVRDSFQGGFVVFGG